METGNNEKVLKVDQYRIDYNLSTIYCPLCNGEGKTRTIEDGILIPKDKIIQLHKKSLYHKGK